MKLKTKILSVVTSCAIAASAAAAISLTPISHAETNTVSNAYEWGTLEVGGGGFVSGIVTGQKEMYLRTDVGGAYKYNYESKRWEQLFDFLNEADRGLSGVKGIAIDPRDDNIAYFLCGIAYFSDARTEIFKTTDGGKTFERIDVTDMIQVHGNGDGRECSEPIAIDPDNPDTIYAGGDVASGSSALIKSTDGGKTWAPVKGYDDLGLFKNNVKWPEWVDQHIVRGTEAGQYNTQNGIASIHIEGGKVYVGTSITGVANIHVADVKKDEFTELSANLPNANYPVTISSDNNGNLFVTYIAGLAFGGGAGGAYKYNIASGKVTDISPASNGIGMITVDKNDPNKLFARTCGLWADQWYGEEWVEKTDDDPGTIAWGDYFFRSIDGGETWTNITPGKKAGEWGKEYFISEPIDTNGYDWIYCKACHWGSGILIDPRNPDKILMTSGNGIFACDNAWDEKGVQFYFDPAGVEEVVALDMVSVPGGPAYSVIGDYDGFVHEDVDKIPLQHKPNMGSTSVIAYCSQNPNIMVRFAEHDSKGYYTTDAGKNWKLMENSGGSGGRGDIAKIDDDTYRIFHTSASGVSYTDDFGKTWSNSSGTVGTKDFGVLVDKEDNNIVYAYSAKYNDYWASDPNKKEPTLDDAQYDFMISTDGGKTFTNQILCQYDQCDIANRLAYLGHDDIIAAAGWYGMYHITNGGKNVEKLDVSYCKTVGYGAPEKEGGVNTLFIYGKPQDSDPEGIYRSTDSGKTWVCINTDHLYGGTGNGNFLVGDMNKFGMVYMSTVGAGIVYGRTSDNPKPPKPTEDTTEKPTDSTVESTEKPTEDSTNSTDDATEPVSETLGSYTGDVSELIYADVDLSGSVNVGDVTKLAKYFINKETYPLGDKENSPESVEKALEQSDVEYDRTINKLDLSKLIEHCLGAVSKDELGPQK